MGGKLSFSEQLDSLHWLWTNLQVVETGGGGEKTETVPSLKEDNPLSRQLKCEWRIKRQSSCLYKSVVLSLHCTDMGSGRLNYCGDLQLGAAALIVLSPAVGITPQLKCVFKATCHGGCLPCCLAPCSEEGDIYDSSPREPGRRTSL